MRLDRCEGALRADLQRYYGINLDDALGGACSIVHLAALANNLPQESASNVALNPDAAWTLEATVLADLRNHLAMLMWGMDDKKRRGRKPKRIGPSWMTKETMRKLEARTMTIDALMKELSKPRGGE